MAGGMFDSTAQTENEKEDVDSMSSSTKEAEIQQLPTQLSSKTSSLVASLSKLTANRELEWDERYEQLRENMLRKLSRAKKPNLVILEALAVTEHMHNALGYHIPECLVCQDTRLLSCEPGYVMCMDCQNLYT